ncbi:uncharacterized protein isoform X2 [Rhodnius prolixus]|uniref:uncharacterized protein isoform X2 n=1 Tax=Rhodnius prolixus TaxID=13249 RepID=UPI003D188575
MPSKKGKKKKPDSHVDDYLEEGDVVMEVLTLKKLRKFCKKLQKTSELLEKENIGFQVEKEKLLAYWKILDKQFWQGVDEKRTLELLEINKDSGDRWKKSEVKNKLKQKLCDVFKNNLNFLKSRSINRMITKRKLDNRLRELSYQIHKRRKYYIMCNYEDLRNEMYQHVIAFKDKYVPFFNKCHTCIDRLQHHYFYERHCLLDNTRELFTRKAERMLKRKERTTRRAMSELVKDTKLITFQCSHTTRKTPTNVKYYEYKVRKISRSFFLLNRKRKALKKKFISYQADRFEKQIERNRMLNIIRNEKKIEKLAKKAEAEYAMALGQQVEAIASYAEGDTNFRKEKQFVNEVRKLSMDEADQIIINHMAKKMLSFIKLKIIKKKIRIDHYILKFILKEDDNVYGLLKDVVNNGNFNLEDPLETYQEKFAAKSTVDLENVVDDDPFCLNCVEESAIKISGTIPCTSMHQTCKRINIKHLSLNFLVLMMIMTYAMENMLLKEMYFFWIDLSYGFEGMNKKLTLLVVLDILVWH